MVPESTMDGERREFGAHLESTTETGGWKPPELAGRRPALRSAAVPAASSRGFPAPRSIAPSVTHGGPFKMRPGVCAAGLEVQMLSRVVSRSSHIFILQRQLLVGVEPADSGQGLLRGVAPEPRQRRGQGLR